MSKSLKRLTDFLVAQGVENVEHTQKTYMGHLVGVYRLMEAKGCSEELCQAGMFHSIYGTEVFQGFKLPVERRPEVRALIGERAEQLAYLNCAMNRPSFYRVLEQSAGPYAFIDRLTGAEVELSQGDFDDLCRIHLYDWIEQAPRSRWGVDFRREAYGRMADRLGPPAREAFDRLFAGEAAGSLHE